VCVLGGGEATQGEADDLEMTVVAGDELNWCEFGHELWYD